MHALCMSSLLTSLIKDGETLRGDFHTNTLNCAFKTEKKPEYFTSHACVSDRERTDDLHRGVKIKSARKRYRFFSFFWLRLTTSSVCVYQLQGVNRCASVGLAHRDGDRQVSRSACTRRGFIINATSAPIRVGVMKGRKPIAARRPPSNEPVTSMAAMMPDDRSPPEKTWYLCQ